VTGDASTDVPASRSDAPAARTSLRLSGEAISGVSAVLLLILMFAAKWYGAAGAGDALATRSSLTSSQNAWQALTLLRWLMLLTALVAIGAMVLRITQRAHGTPTDLSPVVMTLGSLTALLLAYRVLINLPSAGTVLDQKLGAFLGLLCAIGIAFGGYESRRHARKSSRTVVQRSRS
jgi:hypothetical protein